MTTLAAPARGLAFGDYPQRIDAGDTGEFEAGMRALRSRFSWSGASGLPVAVAQAAEATRGRLEKAGSRQLRVAADAVRAKLQRAQGVQPSKRDLGAALGVASAAMARTLGMTPYPTQLLAAWLMLQGRLVEMATGEGKTLTAALAAAVAALRGQPVHVLTANDYLVQRDRAAMAPFFAALGLSSGCVVSSTPREQRGAVWRHAIVYATARELAFDYLRDHLALRGERDARVLRAEALAGAEDDVACGAAPSATPALPGLCCCLVDEADSILLDEAVVPLILAAPARTLDVAAYQRVFELSRTLQRGRDYAILPARRSAELNDAGRDRVAAAVKGAGGVLAPARRACELVEAALAARLCYQRDRDYVLANAKVQLIDELTGRIADGRQWQGALHPMVELKEGLEPSPPTVTAAQITYQRFFPRYLELGGMSGTLLEARHELRVAYGAAVKRVPLAQPNRRVMLPDRFYSSAAHKWNAVLESIRHHQAAGRPVLVGTDSVADSAHLCSLLHAARIEHQLLNALQDADEAERVANAGRAGTVTVATNIAGRGTDIRLDAAAAANGGLHVISAMRNRSRRIDRQLIGRAARHGDPGSAQAMLALDDKLLVQCWPATLLKALALTARSAGRVPGALASPLFTVAQRLAEAQDRRRRRDLRRTDRELAQRHGFSGGTE